MSNEYCPYCMAEVNKDKTCPKCGKSIDKYSPLPHHLPPGTLLKDRYVVGGVLGEGGFGITYIGLDQTLNFKVAIKEYYPIDSSVRNNERSLHVSAIMGKRGDSYESGKRRFLSEAKAMARMVKQHNIVNVSDFFEEHNTAYIVMEYIDGLTLSEICRQGEKRLAVNEALDIIEPIFLALEDLHHAGMIHRDVSPDNIMLENGVVRLLDLGCAKETANMENATTTMAILKHGYAPPEQYSFRGQGAWTDVYALGATIYFMITGKVPPHAYDRFDHDEMLPPSRLGISITKSQEDAIMKSLSIFSRDRFQSMKNFHDALYFKEEDDETVNDSHIEGDGEKEPESKEETHKIEDIAEEKGEASNDKAKHVERSMPGNNANDQNQEETKEKTDDGNIAEDPNVKKKRKKKRKKKGKTVYILSACAAMLVILFVAIWWSKPPIENTMASIGDNVFFGKYEQDNNIFNGKEEIEWIVLAKEDDKLLLISRYILDCNPYHESEKSVTWETCTLRSWLNNDFYNRAFNVKERNSIALSNVSVEDNFKYGTKAGNDTHDHVFLLSISEAEEYFANRVERKCPSSEYADEKGSWDQWWLRSPGYNSYSKRIK